DVPHLDTGAFYRAVTLAVLRSEVDPADATRCGEIAGSIVVTRPDGITHLDDEDVEDEIRGHEVTDAVSVVAKHASVRDALDPLQRAAAIVTGGVVEGRDIGTVVLPGADVKVWLTASVDERARRRAKEMGDRDLEGVKADVLRRDDEDSSRDVAPLTRAPDSWILDTTALEFDQVVSMVVDHVREVRPDAVPRSLRPLVAVVGRPNVGKSTLVNRLIGRRVVIVEEKSGVTRDRTEHDAAWRLKPFTVVDTGGWEHHAEGMNAKIVHQAEAALDVADLVLFVVDVTVGVLDDDLRYAKILRRAGIPVLLVANKADNPARAMEAAELYSLGLGDPRPISAKHGRGVGKLLDEIVDTLPRRPRRGADRPAEAEDVVARVALVGQPNVGKSSLFNMLLGQERSIVDAKPHTTRDSIDTRMEIDGETWVFVDTAGMRRKYRKGEETEKYSVDRTRAAIESADLVMFVLDASIPIGEQDQRLAALVRDAGRGVILVLNKWDLIDEDRRAELETELDRLLYFADWAPRVNVSALTGRGVRRLVPRLREVNNAYRRRIPTRQLNAWLDEVTQRVAPPTKGGRVWRVKYLTQAESAPPRFVAFSSGSLPSAYTRFLVNELREAFDFTGTPLALDDRPPPPRRR
ncbi:MAG: GTP-binding protein, partial [Glaciecola sp.]